jgi:2-polyprenyl-3-methyl-5-hydroxy-6-metoxy-1,4-benzoquinol methylase
MKISEGLQENGVFVGNAYDKYGSKNPFVRLIMKGFAEALSDLVARAAPRTIHEVGCGEGYWVFHWIQQGIQARGSDFSEKIIDLARENAMNRGIPPESFQVCSVYELEPERDSADLLVCCEVLEHLEDPDLALATLQRVATGHLILSVPREPIWRVLNMVRGKYLKSFGNTPGHIQHWSSSKFNELVGNYFDIVEIRTPLPWTMLLCRARG